MVEFFRRTTRNSARAARNARGGRVGRGSVRPSPRRRSLDRLSGSRHDSRAPPPPVEDRPSDPPSPGASLAALALGSNDRLDPLSSLSINSSNPAATKLVHVLLLTRDLINVAPVVFDQQLVDLVQQHLATLQSLEQAGQHDAIEHERQSRIIQLMHYKQRVLSLSSGSNASSSASIGSEDTPSNSGSGRPKKNELPRFSGDPLEWPAFWAPFEKKVMKNKLLDDVERYEYLTFCLPAAVAKTVNFFRPNAPDMEKAIAILKERFESGPLLKGSLFKLVDAILPLKREATYEEWTAFHNLCADVANRSTEKLLSEDTVRDLRLAFEDRLPKEDRDSFKLKPNPSIHDLLTFISKRQDRALRESHENSVREALLKRMASSSHKPAAASSSSYRGRRPGFTPKRLQTAKVYVSVAKYKCSFCPETHFPTECPKSVEDRKVVCRTDRLCFRCLKPFEKGHKCGRRCKNCSGHHHQALCFRKDERKRDGGVAQLGAFASSSPSSSSPQDKANSSSSAAMSSHTSAQPPPGTSSSNVVRSFHNLASRDAFLPLARVRISTPTCSCEINVLFDSGSSASFLAESIVYLLKAQRWKVEPRGIETFNGRLQLVVNQQTLVGVHALDGSFQTDCPWLIMPSSIISDLPVPGDDLRGAARALGIPLATPPAEGGTAVIDGIIGMDVFVDGFMPLVPRHSILEPGVAAVETKIGWVIQGKQRQTIKNRNIRVNVAFVEPIDCDRCGDLRNIFVDPILGVESSEDPLQDQWQRDYSTQALSFDETERRFVARLPWLSDQRPNSNYYSARAQSVHLRDRLLRVGGLEEYNNALQTFIQEGTVEIIANANPQEGYYLPHRPVYKEGTTTSVRPVFNASSAVRGSSSLNECLFKGTWDQTQLLHMILRWRLHSHVVFGDLRKAFLQIRVSPGDRPFLRFLWFHEGHLRVFQFKSVIFGATASPFMLFAALNQLFSNQANPKYKSFPNSVYMDDGLFKGNNPNQLLEDIQNVRSILNVASFDMHKWAAPRWLQAQLTALSDLQFDEEKDVHRALGVIWDLKGDSIIFSDSITPPTELTRRSLASVFGKIFDPLGLLGPFLTRVKLLMRKVIEVTTTWDQPLPAEVQPEAEKLVGDLALLKEYSVPRLSAPTNTYEVWIFADSSKLAYGVCLYIHDLDSRSSRIFMARGRLASDRRTIPQLELCAAVLAAETYGAVQKELNSASAVRFFSDSTVTISRIQSNPNRHEAFVANRIRIIQKFTKPEQWLHVESKLNPADLISRGMSMKQLIDSPLWRNGPTLALSSPSRPLVALAISSRAAQNDAAAKMSNQIAHTPYTRLHLMFLTLLEHMDAQYDLLGRLNREKIAPLTLSQFASVKIWSFVQRSVLAREIELVQRGQPLPKSSQLYGLRLFLDEWKILREKRRLDNADLDTEMRNPIVVLDHPIVRSYARHVHADRLHHIGGKQTTDFINRCVNFVSGSGVVRRIVKACLHCNRMRAQAFAPPLGQLPAGRVQQGPAFSVIGVDLWGPVYAKPRGYCIRGRNRSQKAKKTKQSKKYYGFLFVCANSRAVHIELVCGRDRESIIAAFRRFIARRGLPTQIYSDREGSFGRIRTELKELKAVLQQCQRPIEREFAVRWTLNPPAAPWWGGHYERMVGTVKAALSVHSNTVYTFDELQTVFIQVEGLVNSRPLLQNGDSFEVLTPAHLVIGRPLLQIPPIRLNGAGDDALLDFNKLNRRLNAFWRKWSRSYLTTLRALKEGNQRTPRVGELVIIRESERARGEWPLAEVITLHPGNDNVVRVATVRLISDRSEFTLPAQRLVPLEAAS